MENASKALVIAGAILISILIIAIGMYIFNSSQGSITGAMDSMDIQEIEALNKAWTTYEGRQTGSEVKSLINRLIANANNYREEIAKIVSINSCQPTSGANTSAVFGGTEAQVDAHITNLNTIYSAILARHVYTVDLVYAANGLITGVNITY